MSTATATHTAQSGFASEGRTAWGFTLKILAYCAETGQNLTKSKAERLGVRMKRRADSMQSEFDFYESLRVLGIHTDATARDAEHRASCTRPECDKCGRKRAR